MQTETFFSNLWRDYTSLTPQAARIHRIFLEDGNSIVNDHVAFRTFNLPPVDIGSLEHNLLAMGYRRFTDYSFDTRKLDAWSYLHPDPDQPRIFFSQVRVAELSPAAGRIIHSLCEQVDPGVSLTPGVFWRGRLWEMPTWADYSLLLRESEYAAWVSVIGLRANHFTVSINHLKNPALEYVLGLLQNAGIAMNTEGGIVKGTEADLLMQCSTLADRTELVFADGDRHEVTTCYYEFARRFHDGAGRLYQGFVPASADRIFHSTDTR